MLISIQMAHNAAGEECLVKNYIIHNYMIMIIWKDKWKRIIQSDTLFFFFILIFIYFILYIYLFFMEIRDGIPWVIRSRFHETL